MRTSLGMGMAFKKYTVIAAVCGLLSVPVLVSAQAQESSSSSEEVTAPVSGASSGSPIWGNSSASSIGSTSIIPSAPSSGRSGLQETVNGVPGAGPGAASGTGTGTGATRGGIRIRTGATADGRDPGGNPDVPFDPNMNLCFLLAGIVFSVWVIRRKYALKPASVNK